MRTDLSLLNSHNWCEDAPDEPLFIKFSKVFEDKTLYGLNEKVRQFEASHPHIRLVNSDDCAKNHPVFSNYLFLDNFFFLIFVELIFLPFLSLSNDMIINIRGFIPFSSLISFILIALGSVSKLNTNAS